MNDDKEKQIISPFKFKDKELNNDCYNDEYSLKELLIDEIFYIKFTAKNHEIPNNVFEEMQIEPYDNCFYCFISFYLFKTKNRHLVIRDKIFKFIISNKELFYLYFNDNDDTNLSVEDMLDNYII